MNKNRNLKRIFAAALALVLCTTLCIPIFADSADQVIDASRPGSLYNKTLDSAELLEEILAGYSGEYDIGEAERSYLVKYGKTSLTYNYAVGNSSISVNFNEENRTLDVAAYEYSYSSAGEGTVTWIPVSAELNGVLYTIERGSDGGYRATFSDVDSANELAAVRVKYSLSIKVDRSIAGLLVNKAYNDAAPLIAEHEQLTSEYNAKMTAYLEAVEEYESYITALEKYNDDLKKYNAYLKALASYESALAEYEQYLADKAKYDIAKSAYDKYLAEVEQYKQDSAAYNAYLEALNEYESDKVKYAQYQQNKEQCQYHIRIMWISAQKIVEDTHDVRSHLKYNTIVHRILSEKDTFTGDLGDAPPALFDIAAEATENLKTLVGTYYSCDNEYEKYAVYSTNYEAFRENFTNLFICLHYLQNNPSVSSAIISEGKTREFNVFVATLYLITQRLNDGSFYSVDPALVKGSYNADKYRQFDYTDSRYNYTGINGVSLADILGDYTPVEDKNDSKPVPGGYPTPMEKPVKPTAVAEPTAPAVVAPPAEPDEVSNPGDPPKAVANPGRAPAEVAEPTEPEPYVQDPVKAAVISAYQNGEIAKRDLIFNTDPTVTFTTEVEKRFINVKQHLVRFYDTDGKTVIYSLVVESGSMVDYDGRIPTKAEDARATYTFSHWTDKGGNRVDLSLVNSDISLYPAFSETLKSYTVTWNVADRITTQSVLYGETPTYSGPLDKPDSNYYTYTFAGWDKPIAPVKGNTVYTAVFDGKYIVPLTGGGAAVVKVDGGYIVDLTKSTDSDTNIIAAIKKAAEINGTLTINIKSLSVFLSEIDVLRLAEVGACRVSASVSVLGGRACTYTFTLTDAQGEVISSGYRLKLSTKCDLALTDRLILSYSIGGEKKSQGFTLDNGALSFTAASGVKYTLSYEYSLIPTSSYLDMREGMYSAGETVYVKLKTPDGVSIKHVYYVDSDGNKTEIIDGSFIMPDKDITIVAETERIKYKVTFVNEGVTISEQYYNYGDTPTPPSNPKKVSDDTYEYMFVGWSEEISPVTGDAVYTAVYESQEIEEILDTDTGYSLSDKAIMLVVVVAAVVLLILIVALIVKIYSI